MAYPRARLIKQRKLGAPLLPGLHRDGLKVACGNAATACKETREVANTSNSVSQLCRQRRNSVCHTGLIQSAVMVFFKFHHVRRSRRVSCVRSGAV